MTQNRVIERVNGWPGRLSRADHAQECRAAKAGKPRAETDQQTEPDGCQSPRNCKVKEVRIRRKRERNSPRHAVGCRDDFGKMFSLELFLSQNAFECRGHFVAQPFDSANPAVHFAAELHHFVPLTLMLFRAVVAVALVFAKQVKRNEVAFDVVVFSRQERVQRISILIVNYLDFLFLSVRQIELLFDVLTLLQPSRFISGAGNRSGLFVNLHPDSTFQIRRHGIKDGSERTLGEVQKRESGEFI